MSDEAPQRHPRFQFRISMLLAAILVVSLLLSWCIWNIEQSKRQEEIGRILEGAGSIVAYEDVELTFPQKIRAFLGERIAHRVLTSVLVNEQLVNADGEVVDSGWRNFGDDEAAYLEELPNLKVLSLSNTRIGDAGLTHLKELTSIETLYLNNTKLSDAGLEHLNGLTGLKVLHLKNTQVTSEGVKKLQTAQPNCSHVEY